MIELEDLSGETTIWMVRLTLRGTSGYTLYGGANGEHEDRLLVVKGRLVLAATPSDLWAKLPSMPRDSFGNDTEEAFTAFCEGSRMIELSEVVDDSIAHLDFGSALSILSEGRAFEGSGSSAVFDCLNASIDLGEQLGTDSQVYQVAKNPTLSTLYKALWGTVDRGGVDQEECVRDMNRLIDMIEDVIDR